MPTNIEYVNETWNPVTGCGPDFDCWKYCYARKLAEGRLRGRCGYPQNNPFQPGLEHPNQWEKPLHWRKPKRIFVCSMGDLFHDAVPFGLVDQVGAVAALSPQHTFMLLTKRPKRMHEYFVGIQSGSNETVSRLLKHPNYQRALHAPVLKYREGVPLPNLWLGVTAENQEMADKRIPWLIDIPAAKRFVSIEPMQGPVDLTNLDYKAFMRHVGYKKVGLHPYEPTIKFDVLRGHMKGPDDVGLPRLDWVICGGETGPGARPMHPGWVRGLRDQCVEAGVPFFFKHFGEWEPCGFADQQAIGKKCTTLESRAFYRVGKKAAGRELDGRTWDQVPDQAREVEERR